MEEWLSKNKGICGSLTWRGVSALWENGLAPTSVTASAEFCFRCRMLKARPNSFGDAVESAPRE